MPIRWVCIAWKLRFPPVGEHLKPSGFGSSSDVKELVKVGFGYFRINAAQVQSSLKPNEHDFHLHVVEVHNTGLIAGWPFAI